MNTIVWVLVGFIVVLCIFFMVVFRQYVRLQNQVRDAYLTLDVYLRRRWDQAAGIAALIRRNGMEEPASLSEVLGGQGDSFSYEQLPKEAKFRKAGTLFDAIAGAMEWAKGQPALGEDEAFLSLCQQFISDRAKLDNAAFDYNEAVKKLNAGIRKNPQQLVAKTFGIEEELVFEKTGKK